MAIDPEVAAAYRSLDTSALISLLPLLNTEADRMKVEIAHLTLSKESSIEGDGLVADSVNEALAAWSARMAREGVEDTDFFESMRSQLQNRQGQLMFDDEEWKAVYFAACLRLADVGERTIFVRKELEHRLVLPRRYTEDPAAT